MGLLSGASIVGGMLIKGLGKILPGLKVGEATQDGQERPKLFSPSLKWLSAFFTALLIWEIGIKKIILTYWPHAKLPDFGMAIEDLFKLATVIGF